MIQNVSTTCTPLVSVPTFLGIINIADWLDTALAAARFVAMQLVVMPAVSMLESADIGEAFVTAADVPPVLLNGGAAVSDVVVCAKQVANATIGAVVALRGALHKGATVLGVSASSTLSDAATAVAGAAASLASTAPAATPQQHVCSACSRLEH